MEKIESIDYWYYLMTKPDQLKEKTLIKKMFNSLKKELPFLCSLILERFCNLNCAHCFFQAENSSKKVSQSVNLAKKIENIASQLPKNSSIIHEGRILQDWHIPILKNIREIRKDLSIGLIDNGSFLLQKDILEKNDFKFDWIDISIDGAEKNHNLQRRNQGAFKMAVCGLQEAKKYVKESGKISSLFTVTSINYQDLTLTSKFLIENNLIDELHVTPASKSFSKEQSIVMNDENFLVFWDELKKASVIGQKDNVPVKFRVYKLEDLVSLSKFIGKQKIISSFKDAKNVLVDRGNISFLIDGIRVLYIPLSICPSETFIIDADGKYRLPYCIEYTLTELNKGIDKNGDDISCYTVAEINEGDSFKELYKLGVEKWVLNFGLQYLKEEIYFFRNKS